jgi:hypothetical protein
MPVPLKVSHGLKFPPTEPQPPIAFKPHCPETTILEMEVMEVTTTTTTGLFPSPQFSLALPTITATVFSEFDTTSLLEIWESLETDPMLDSLITT